MAGSDKNMIRVHVLTGAVLTGCFVFFCFFYRYHIWFEEQMRIFLLTPGYFMTYLDKPAILSSFISDFLTQFFYLTGGGAVVITVSLFIFWFLVKKLNIPEGTGRNAALYALLPVLLSWIALMDFEFPLAAVVSLIISVLCTLIVRGIRNRLIRIACFFVLLPVVYLAAGSTFYLFALACLSYEISGSGMRRSLSLAVPAIIIMALIPFLAMDLFHLTGFQAYTWISDSKRNPRFLHFLPMISLVPALIAPLFVKRRRTQAPAEESRSFIIVVFAALAVLTGGVTIFADFTLEKILKLDYEASHENWQKVCNLASRYQLRNSLASYYTNMALGKLGLLPEKLLEFYQPAATGLFIPVNADENYLTITFSNEVYWQLGDANAAQHSALLGMIFSPHSRNVRLMKRLAEINLVNGQYDVAAKYIRILEKTLYHRKWAQNRAKLLMGWKLLPEASWLASKRDIIPVNDRLKLAGDYKGTLKMLIDDHPGNSMAVDYLLCYDLLSKDLDSFTADFRKYYRQHGIGPLPRVYQEAILMQIAAGKFRHEEFPDHMFNPGNIRRIADYTRIFAGNDGKGSALQKDFGTTYWFYYHFASLKRE